MKKKIMNNLGLKILAILSSIVLWLIVVNINDPITTTTYTGIPVEILNADTITQRGKTYQVLDGTDTVNVTITAKKTVINGLNKEDIHAIADIAEMTDYDTVGITVSTDKASDSIENIKTNIVNLKLEIEDLKETQIPIEVSTSGDPKEGYLVGDVIAAQNVIRLSGPKSVIDSIVSAEAIADVTNTASDVKTSAEIKLFDADGRLIENKSIDKNLTTVNITVLILGTKTIPIEYNVSGTPVDGYALTGQIDSTPSEVTIAAKLDTLKEITSLEIPETAINVTGQSRNMATIVDITKYLPEGVTLADSEFNGKATVHVYIEAESEEKLDITKEDIVIKNVPEGKVITIESIDTSDTLTAVGLKSNLEMLKIYPMYGVIDIKKLMSDLKVENLISGSIYEREAEFTAPEGIDLRGSVTVKIKIGSTSEE